jgi:hypothetical protein
MNQIVVLSSSTQADGSFTVSGVFWLTTPANKVVPHPTFKSTIPQVSSADLLSLQQGTITETPFTSGLFPPDTAIADVRTVLETMLTDAQVALDATNPPVAGLVGATFNGTTWGSSGALDPAWIAAQNPPKTPDGAPLMSIAQRQSDGIPQIAIAPTTGSETVIASHNLCDKSSWFGDSARARGETLIDSGNGTLFNSAHTYWIDMISGRVHNDDHWVDDQKARNPGDPHGYAVIVKVGGVTQTMREPFEASGGDYEVIWETGQVQFFTAPASAPVVDYSYATTSTFYVRPTPGKLLRILKAEVDVATGTVMTDTVMYDVYGLVDAVAPQFIPAVPSGTMIPIGQVVYKRMGQIASEAQGAYPPIESLGASDADLLLPIEEFRRKSRGTRNRVQGLPFNYETTRDLSSAAHMEVRVHTMHDRPFEGDTVTVTFYCVSKDEV